ncbi:MAG: peroxiredoxin [Acidobacteria bacterium]|nr:MAG: peroxiredoxin [Acidobacteriota bacterium]PYY04901.1 MAG: peroxiredoxin [Acidobacteriota bacterium]PYY23046.1 MAG: peroxiredoxin [Acidobacteriota bacterium]
MRLLAVALVSILFLESSLNAAHPLSSLLVGGDAESIKIVSEGEKAPNFTLPSQDGSSISLDQYRGKWVVLYFYPKDFTQGCTIEAHNFQRDEAQYQSKGAVILGVSLDSSDSHKEFCAKEGLNFKLLSDQSAKVVNQYGSLTEFQGKKYAARNTFIIDPDGVVRKIFKGVKPNGHSQEVLVTLADLQHAKA